MASPLELLNSFQQRLDNAINQPSPSRTVGAGGSRSSDAQASRFGVDRSYQGVSGRFTPKGNAQFPIRSEKLFDFETPQVRSNYTSTDPSTAELRFKAESVSYTHLTLPTILLV